jgi:uncharacterized protein with PQ loop repeat
MRDGLHHYYKRKHQAVNNSSVLNQNNFKRITDILVYIGGVVGPLGTIPQVLEIWLYKNAAGVSAISWSAYFIGAIFWFFYGLAHKEKPIIFTYGIWAILDVLIIVGVFIYS